MPSNNVLQPELKNSLFTILDKYSSLTKKDQLALWSILSVLIGSFRFSFKKVSDLFGRNVSRKYLAKVMKKFAFVQESLFKALLEEIVQNTSSKTKYYILIDDTMVEKAGKHIFRTFKWYDHANSRVINAICLVTLAVVVNNQVVFLMPWILTKPTKINKKSSRKLNEQDAKTIAAMSMINDVVSWLNELGISNQNIVVEADSWFSSATMRNFLTNLKVLYRIDAKTNFTVQMPDHEAIRKAKTQTRGRKRTRFTKSVPIKDFLGEPENWSGFTSKSKNIFVKAKKVSATLKAGGKSTVYAYWINGKEKLRIVLTNMKKRSQPTVKTVFRDYGYRWWIEVAHREVKQQFGIAKCQSRDDWVVSGFLGFICFSYSLAKQMFFQHNESPLEAISIPTWADLFHYELMGELKKVIN